MDPNQLHEDVSCVVHMATATMTDIHYLQVASRKPFLTFSSPFHKTPTLIMGHLRSLRIICYFRLGHYKSFMRRVEMGNKWIEVLSRLNFWAFGLSSIIKYLRAGPVSQSLNVLQKRSCHRQIKTVAAKETCESLWVSLHALHLNPTLIIHGSLRQGATSQRQNCCGGKGDAECLSCPQDA